MTKKFLLSVVVMLCVGLLLSACGDGAIEEFHKNEKIKSRYYTVINEKGGEIKHGLYQQWDDKGTLRDSINYDMGRKNGVVKAWYGNGQLEFQGKYNLGQPVGKHEEWDDLGNKLRETNYAAGKKDGAEITWNKKGVKTEETHYKAGEKHGAYSSWNDEGVLKHSVSYVDGKKHGEESIWCPEKEREDVKREHRFWNMGLREGTETYHHCLTGEKSSILNWKEDKMHGEYISWDNEGKKIVEKYEDGVKLEK